MSRRLLSAIALATGVLSGSVTVASASVTFFDGTFDLGADYTVTPSFVSDPATTINYSQCASCGNPGTALQITAAFPNQGPSNASADIGFVNTGFAYDPLTQGVLTSISASVDKNVITDSVGPGKTNTFRPLIAQGGLYYLAAISGPTFTGPTGPSGTGYLSFSGNLTASDFTQYDFATGTFGAAHPNFGGPTLTFGIGQIATLQPGNTFTVDYDNLNLRLSAVPLPASAPLFGTALLALGALGYRLNGRERRRLTEPSQAA